MRLVLRNLQFTNSLNITLGLHISCRHASQRAQRTFVDNVRLYVRGGSGGQGLPRYGGVGGRGGSVYVKGDEKASLKKLLSGGNGKRYIGQSGQNSKPMMLHGPPGEDIDIAVPPGVEVLNDAGRVLGEINELDERVLVARGGAGGGPVNSFNGQRAVSFHVRLNLKLIADVGLVGFPNAGKSTLLSALSRATPRIASYPFTTIQPQLGIMEYADHRQVSVADLPGLIEGAHLNVGMGYRFLKHVERTKMLMFVVDLHGFRLSLKHPHRTAAETVLLLTKELELYKPELLTKPAILVLNKVDQQSDGVVVSEVLEQLTSRAAPIPHTLPAELLPKQPPVFDDVLAISARERLSTEEVKERVRTLLDVYADRQQSTDLRPVTAVSPDRPDLTEQVPHGPRLV